MRLRIRTSESQGVVVAKVLDLPDVWAAGENDDHALSRALAEIEKHFAQRNRAAEIVQREAAERVGV
jgi:hypothetical protein